MASAVPLAGNPELTFAKIEQMRAFPNSLAIPYSVRLAMQRLA
jgi:hypothetical protein